MSKVSVIVPIYNPGKKLDRCIKSILNQTFQDIEVILVNDGSTDNSLEKCLKYHEKDLRINVINKKNEGSIKARRRGVESSNSDYVMFVDADDWINQETVETLYNESVQNNLDIAVCNMYKVLGKGHFIRQKNNSKYFHEDQVYNKEQIKKDLLTAYFHGHPFPSSLCAKLYRRELLLKNGSYLDRIIFLGDDLFYNMEMFLKADRVKVIDRPFYYYSSGGLTSKYMPYLFDDAVNGYQIQKEVIDRYYPETKQKQYNGISIMLLNTFKTCLCNLFKSQHNKPEIEDQIKEYISDENIQESICNNSAIKYFPPAYLNAIKNQDIDFLFDLGFNLFEKRRRRQLLVNMVNRIVFV